MAWLDVFRNRSEDSAIHASQRWPVTDSQWQTYYNLRDDAYKGNPYTIEEIKSLGLFRALDLDGKVIAETRRLGRDVQYVVNRDAEALAPDDLSWELTEDGEAAGIDDAVAAIWRRSKIDTHISGWARMCGAMGMIALEAVRTTGTPPYNARIVRYDPRHVEDMVFDEYGDLIRLVINIAEVNAPASVTGSGVLDRDMPGTTYKRVLTRDRIDVYRDGQLSEEESGEHGLGVVPAVVVPFLPYHEPGRGLWAAQGLDYSLAMVDSILTQIQAVGNRHGNPILVPVGFRLEGNTDFQQMGRVLEGLPQGASASYLEATLTGLSTLLDTAQQARERARETLPEFLFTDAGASSSGSALNFRAASFVSKMRSVRKHWYRNLADVIEMAVALERNQPYDSGTDLLRITAGPVLPVNVEAELKVTLDAMEAGGMTLIDFVKRLQRLGLIDQEADPAEYAATVQAEQAANDERIMRAAAGAAEAATPDIGVVGDNGELVTGPVE